MAINVSQAFHRTSANPVDESMTLTKAQMKTVNDNLMPAYYFTVCQDDGYIYLYDKSATATAESGKFKKFEGGGGGSTSETITGTLLSSGWDSNNQQTLTFAGIDATTNGTIGCPITATAAQIAAYESAGITVVSIDNDDEITFEAKDIPAINLPVVLITV